MDKWTIESVKEKLPQVPVLVANRRVMCSLNGRKLDFPHVTLPDGGTVEVSWETVARVLNREEGVLLL